MCSRCSICCFSSAWCSVSRWASVTSDPCCVREDKDFAASRRFNLLLCWHFLSGGGERDGALCFPPSAAHFYKLAPVTSEIIIILIITIITETPADPSVFKLIDPAAWSWSWSRFGHLSWFWSCFLLWFYSLLWFSSERQDSISLILDLVLI